MERVLTGRRVETLCLVCGDKASGRHYGVPSCDGCRGFFKRSIRRNLDYICKESNQCIVDVSRRNQCQACRFRRCLEVNMKRDGIGAVQHERAPRGTLKRTYPSEFMSSTPLLPPSSLNVGHFYAGSFSFPWRPNLNNILQVPSHFPLNVLPPHFPGFPQASLHTTGAANESGEASGDPAAAGSTQRNPCKEDEVSSSANEDSFNRRDQDSVSKNLERSGRGLNLSLNPLPKNSGPESHQPNVSSMVDPSIQFIPQNFDFSDNSNDSSEAAARLLFLTVRWTRTIPSFSHLSYRDQTLLLEETWHELFILTVAQWGLNLEEAVAVLGNNSTENSRELLIRGLQQLREIVGRVHLFRLDHTEYAFLKALVLFKPETRGLRDSVAVELLQDQTQMMLQEYCANSGQSFTASISGSRHSLSAGRFGKLLLLLPAFRSVRDSSIKELFFRPLIGDIPITRLLADLMGSTF